VCNKGFSAARSAYSLRYSSSSVSNDSIPDTNQCDGSDTDTVYGWIGGWATNWLPRVSAHKGKIRGDSTPLGPPRVSAALVP